MDANKLMGVLDKHAKWWRNEDGGERADLTGADLTGADLTGANLSRARLIGADLRWDRLIEADLTGADLTGADLTGADLSRARLIGADLRWARLIGANLSGARLIWANLARANLTRANLARANLTRADLTGADIDYSCWPLWCGSNNVKVDDKIARQLAAHFCVLDCDDAEYIAAREAILQFARKSHRASDLGLVNGDSDK